MLPADTRVYLSAPGVHYNPKYWSSPATLDPHRWAASDPPTGSDSATADDTKPKDSDGKRILAADKTRHMRGTLLTFSDGSRSCLGRKFAQAEYVAFLAALLRDFEVVLANEDDRERLERDVNVKCAGKVTLAMVEGVKLRLKKRVVEKA